MVVCEQLTALIAFMEEHRDLALGNLSRSTEGRMLSKKLWANCAQILNNTAGGGPTKSAAEWRTFYNEYKARTLKKIKLKRREICAPGEIPVKRIVITPLQERLYKVLRNPQVQEEPLPETSSHCQQTPSICGWESSSHCQQTPPRFNTFVDIKAQKVESPSSYEAPCACEPPRQKPRIDADPVEEGYNDSIESAQTSLEAAQATLERIENSYARAISEQAQATNRLAAAIEDVAHGRVATALEHIASSLATYVQTVKDIKAQKVESPSSYEAPCACEPPRQKPRIDADPVEEGYNDSIESAQTSLEAAQATLERIENSYARAISEQAQATNRLAAAIEDVAHGRVATALEHIASSLATYVQTVKSEPESGTEE